MLLCFQRWDEYLTIFLEEEEGGEGEKKGLKGNYKGERKIILCSENYPESFGIPKAFQSETENRHEELIPIR